MLIEGLFCVRRFLGQKRSKSELYGTLPLAVELIHGDIVALGAIGRHLLLF